MPLPAFRVAGAVPRASQKGLRRGLSPLVPLPAFRVAGAVSRASRRACGARCRRWCRWLSSWQAQYQSLQKGLRRGLSPLVPLPAFAVGAVPRASRKGLRRALSPLVPLAGLVAGAVPRASRRDCGARCRRWCRWLSSWQAQYPEPPVVPLPAFVAGAVPRASQKGLRRALSPLVPLAVFVAGAVPRVSQKGLRRALSPLGAVPRASRRGCGARCRRWYRWLSSWQAQYPEPPEGTAARVVAAGAAGCLPRGRRSTQSLQKGLRRGLLPLVPLAVFLVARRDGGARCRRWCRWLSASWQAQHPEPSRRGCGARCRRWYRWLSSSGWLLRGIFFPPASRLNPASFSTQLLNLSPASFSIQPVIAQPAEPLPVFQLSLLIDQ